MKISTKQDLKVVKAFQKHTYIGQSKSIIILLSIIFIFALLCIFAKEYYTGGFIIFFEIIFVFAYPLSIHVANEKLNKSNKSLSEVKNVEYEFLEESFIVKSFVNNEEVETFKSDYNKIFKIDETRGYIFIYIANNTAHCIDKNDVNENDLIELKTILKNKNLKYREFKR